MRGKFNGAKHVTEAWDCRKVVVGERRIQGGSQSESTGGPYSSENAGMSSENYVGIIMAENLRFPGEGSSAQGRFPGEGSSAQGKPGAKARPKGVVDAHTVEIP